MKIFAIVLIIIGAAMLYWTSFSYTKKEQVVHVGPIHLSADRKKTISWPPYTGGVLVAVGAVILVVKRKRR
jgi:hypothetical protein